MENKPKTTEEKIDMILGQVLTIQGEVTILKGQMKSMQGQMNNIEQRMDGMEERMNGMQGQMNGMETRLEQKLDEKLDKKFKEFKQDLVIQLVAIFKETDKKFDENEAKIKKLPCVSPAEKWKSLMSKTN